MLEGTAEFPPRTSGDEREIARVREDYSKEAEPLGSVPPPASVGAAVKTAAQGIRGLRPTQFIDKLGERLAFERTGVRLYEALISKYDAFGSFEGGPSRLELERMMQQEHDHFRMLTDAVAQVGGDPTVITPSADLQATMSKGILEIMVDPRTTFVQCLDALLVAELADNDCWEALSELAQQGGHADLARMMLVARTEEAQHLQSVRMWIAAAQNRTRTPKT
jgi:rubrerythrin